MFPDIVRRIVPIPNNMRLHVAISIGYPDLEFPANKVETGREPLERIVSWCGFDKDALSGSC